MCHVLVIEDEWLIAAHIGSLAEEAGASSVSYAATEADAIEEARSCPPVLILSDYRLARGTGPAAVKLIREEIGHVPAIFITGTPDQCVTPSGSDPVLSKPVADREVIETFRRLAVAAA